MTLGIKDVNSWKTAFLESVQDLAGGVLGGVAVATKDHKQEMPCPLLGAFVQVVCPEGPVLLGLTGTNESCDGLARLMLGMAPDEPIEEADSFDAVGEMMNIVAGGIKTKLSKKLGPIEIGLPVFLSGRLRAVGHIVVESIEVTIGPHTCELLVFALTGN